MAPALFSPPMLFKSAIKPYEGNPAISEDPILKHSLTYILVTRRSPLDTAMAIEKVRILRYLRYLLCAAVVLRRADDYFCTPSKSGWNSLCWGFLSFARGSCYVLLYDQKHFEIALQKISSHGFDHRRCTQTSLESTKPLAASKFDKSLMNPNCWRRKPITQPHRRQKPPSFLHLKP